MDGEWLTLSEAARRLGVSKQTVRRRLKQDALEGRQVDTPFGPTWQVHVPILSEGVRREGTNGYGQTHPHEQGDGDLSDGGPAIILEHLRVISRQQDQLLQLAGRIGWLEAQLGTTQE